MNKLAIYATVQRLTTTAVSCLCLTLAACGGGGESPSTAPLQPIVTTTDSQPIASQAPTPALSADVAVVAANDPGTALAMAVEASTEPLATAQEVLKDLDRSNATAVAVATTSFVNGASPPQTLENAPVADSTQQQLSLAAAVVSTAGVTATPPTYFVDSTKGSDSNNGMSATTVGATGPWRTLAKLAAANLSAGDQVRLVCGSAWNETLKLATAGTATLPITVAAYPSGCANPPLIDGATPVPSAAWTLYQGKIYKATVPGKAQQLYVTGGPLALAHHPNRGYDAAAPDSMYLKVAIDSDKTIIGSKTVSTTLTTGSDLKLPISASLQPGAQVRIRSSAWSIDESSIASVSGSRITLSTPTRYALNAGWGYYLANQLWMLDSGGEWYQDTGSNTLFAWMPDSAAPGARVAVGNLPIGINLQGNQYIVIDGLSVRRTGIGIDARRANGIVVKNSRIEDVAGQGIDLTASTNATVWFNTFVRTEREAILGVGLNMADATGMKVTGNAIGESGIVVSGAGVPSIPVGSTGAIRAGKGATITGNVITIAGYHGIWPGVANTVSGNVVSGACGVLDDCGGIYVSGVANNSVISNNLILNSRQSLAGKRPQEAYTLSQGIYLDESTSGVTVTGNTAYNNDYGIHVHVSALNTVSQNKLYGNRYGQLWMQETRNTVNSGGDIYSNLISGNQIVATSASSKAIWLDTIYGETVHFGTFDGNRYFDRLFGTIVNERTSGTSSAYTLQQWQTATASSGASRRNEGTGWAASQTPFATASISGSNIVPNGGFNSATPAWSSWNQTKPYGSLVREACASGWCARYVTGASPGLINSPNFSTVAGQWYRLAIDVSTGTDGQSVDMVVRRGGGGTNGYESLSDRSLKFTAKRAWTRYAVVFKATKTVNASDLSTLDLGARVDFQNVQPGQLLSVSNLEIVPVAPVDSSTRSDLLLNTGSNPLQVACPVAATQLGQCANYVRLSDSQVVSWPYYLPARSSEIVYTRDPSMVDSDRDGIADVQDTCPNTPSGSGVNFAGCALGQ